MQPLITVLTPTYNRAHTLGKLYESLLTQTKKNFVWFVSDDGSSDETNTIIKRYQEDRNINIVYLYGENGGKHRALNRAIAQISTELTFIVDSDDYLPEDAMEIIEGYHERFKQADNLCGYSFLKVYPDGSVNDKLFPVDERIESYLDSRINGRIGGDKAEVFFTSCLSEFPFSEYEGERFIGEATVWIRMAEKYDMLHINKPVYICEYIEGGLTKSGKRVKAQSPRGGMEYGRLLMTSKCHIDIRFFGCIYYVTMSCFAGLRYKEFIKQSPSPVMTSALYPVGRLIYYYYQMKFRRPLGEQE